jgi:hypothetical protein
VMAPKVRIAVSIRTSRHLPKGREAPSLHA